MELFRPTGRAELALVAASGWRRWPPRLPEQPIFYPVTTYDYAAKIARDWNSTRAAPDNLGFVTRFILKDAVATRYPVQLAGGRDHAELWIPAEDLEVVNDAIEGLIEPLQAWRGGAPVTLDEVWEDAWPRS